MAAVVALLAAVVVLLAGALIQLQRSHAHLTREVAALRRTLDRRPPSGRTPETTTPARPTAPIAAAPTPTGGSLIAFLNPDCTTCAVFWDAFAAGVEVPSDVELDVVTEDLDAPPTDEFAGRVSALAGAGITVRHDSATWRRHDVPVSPYFVLVDPDGAVRAEGTANTWSLVRTILGLPPES